MWIFALLLFVSPLLLSPPLPPWVGPSEFWYFSHLLSDCHVLSALVLTENQQRASPGKGGFLLETNRQVAVWGSVDVGGQLVMYTGTCVLGRWNPL